MARKIAPLIVALAIVVAGCGDDENGGTASPSSTTASTAPPTSASETTVPGLSAANAVERWVGLLADGDLDAAWDQVAPASQEAIGGREGYERAASGLAEGWAAFGRSPDMTYEVVGTVGTADLVLLRGEVTREGMTEEAAVVIPVHGERVDPFVGTTTIELPVEVGEAGTFDVYALGGREVLAWADGTPAEAIAVEGSDGDRQRVTFQGAGADIEVVVAATIDPAGVVAAAAAVLDDGE